MELSEFQQGEKSTLGREGVILKRKRTALIMVAVLLVVAAIIGLAVGVSQQHAKKSDGKHKSGAPKVQPSPPPGSSTSSSSSHAEATRRLEIQQAYGKQITPQVLDSFLAKLSKAAKSLSPILGDLPKQPLSSGSLLKYINDMNVPAIWDGLVSSVRDNNTDLKSLSPDDLGRLYKEVRTMFSHEGLTAWYTQQADTHKQMTGQSLTLAELTKLVDPALLQNATIPNSNMVASKIPISGPKGATAGRKLMDAHLHGAKRELNLLLNCYTEIPLAFHVLTYPGAPREPSADWDAAAAQMVKVLNQAFENWEYSQYFGGPESDTLIRFRVGEVRTDLQVYNYLEIDQQLWMGCGQQENNAAMMDIAAKHNVDPLLYPNIYICGDKTYPQAAGYAYVPNKGNLQNVEQVQHQAWDHIFVHADYASITGMNRLDKYNAGGWVLAHEMGHYFGLSHTHYDAAEVCIDGDSFTDTNPTLQCIKQAYASSINSMCDTWRSGGVWPAVGPNGYKFEDTSSCPGTIDPVFNIMSYTPPSCSSHFTKEQVDRMRVLIRGFRVAMYNYWQIC